MPIKKPRLNRAGIVLNPNISMTIAPPNALPVLMAVIAKKYTKPQGNNPLSIPSR